MTQLSEEILELARQCCGSELKLDVLKKKLYQHVNKMTRAEIMELWEEGLRDIFEKHYKILLTGSKKTYGRELGYVVYARNWRSNLIASIRSMISDEQFDEILVKTEKR